MTISSHSHTVGVVNVQTLPQELFLRDAGNDVGSENEWLTTTVGLYTGTATWGSRRSWFLFPGSSSTPVYSGTVTRTITGLDVGRSYTAQMQFRAIVGASYPGTGYPPPTVKFGTGISTVVTEDWTERSFTFTASATSHVLSYTASVPAVTGNKVMLWADNLLVTALAWAMPPSVVPLALKDGTVTLDESWVPYAQANLRLPLPDSDMMARLDPRTKPRLVITANQDFGTARAVSALSGGTLATLTTRYKNQTILGVSSDLGRGFNPEGVRAGTQRVWDLSVRSRTIDHLTGEVLLFATSDEGLLMDYAPPSVLVSAPNVRAAVALALSKIGANLEPGSDDATLSADANIWRPGVSGWDFVQPLVDTAGLRLYCDEQRRWHLGKPLSATDEALYVAAAHLTQLEDVVSRDEGWYDAVTVTYTWTDSAGLPQIRYDVATSPAYSRMLTVEYDRPWVGDGAAAALLARGLGRGQVSQVETVSDYSAAPGALMRVAVPGSAPLTGVVSRVEWRLGADDMSVRSRDLTTTPARSWLAQEINVAWEDLPAGTTWNTY